MVLSEVLFDLVRGDAQQREPAMARAITAYFRNIQGMGQQRTFIYQ
jgi:hypothetical protein